MTTPDSGSDDRPDYVPQRSWGLKFVRAFRGIARGVASESSFAVHLPMAIAVAIVAAWLRVDRMSWAILIGCIAAVLGAELFNSSIEILARRIDRKENPAIRDALDIAGGAVLVVSLGAMAAGLVILGPPLWERVWVGVSR